MNGIAHIGRSAADEVSIFPSTLRTLETRYLIEPVDRLDPLRLYQRRWAMTVLDNALAKLEQECSASWPSRWTTLQIVPDRQKGSQTYAQVGAELGISEAAVKMAVSRLRQRCRELLRKQIADGL